MQSPKIATTRKKTSGKIITGAISFLLIVCVFSYLTLIHKLVAFNSLIGDSSSSSSSSGSLGSPRDVQKLQQRLRYLETKVDSYMAFHRDPFLSTKATTRCQKQVEIQKIACEGKPRCEVDNSVVCLDDLPYQILDDGKKKKNCVVYDFGIRESPDFGLAFAKQCDVVGFDPSPISIQWWKNSKEKILQDYPGYQFAPVGAAGVDGELLLREYDWGQVSIIEFPKRVVNTNDCDTKGNCKYTFHKQQKTFPIPVATLSTIMREHKHKRISLLKLDVEGSEYSFLESMIDDLSCRKVDQLVLEWHHYDYDVRYGVTSNPQINVLVALLKERCGLEQFWVHGSKGWPSNQKLYADMGMNLYYTLSAFKRTKWKNWNS